MAKTKTKGLNRSQAIRDYMAKNRDANAQQVVDGLKADGIKVTVGLVHNVKAYAAKKKAAKKKSGPKATKTKTAAASTNGSTTKADAIREVAKGMGKRVRPMEVRAALSAKGIEVSYTQVGQVLASMGMKKRKRRRKAGAGSAAPAGVSNGLSIDDLVMAKKLVAQVGSIEKVKEALSALARLG